MMKRLDGQLALVTGSSRGIGVKVAEGLADLGCNIIDSSLIKMKSSSKY